jgi:hypothetical protein
MRNFIAVLVILLVSGCGDDSAPSYPPENTLSASERVELGLPPEGELTLATEVDRDFVAKLSPDTIRAVERYFKSAGEDAMISAARPAGEYLLLWIGFSEVVDGGMDVIWSVEDQKCLGTFLGGYRG